MAGRALVATLDALLGHRCSSPEPAPAWPLSSVGPCVPRRWLVGGASAGVIAGAETRNGRTPAIGLPMSPKILTYNGLDDTKIWANAKLNRTNYYPSMDRFRAEQDGQPKAEEESTLRRQYRPITDCQASHQEKGGAGTYGERA